MEMMNTHATRHIGPIRRVLFKLAGVDDDTLLRCPPTDWKNIEAVAEIQLFGLAYFTLVFSMITERLYGDGQLRPDLILLSFFLASFLVLIDSYMVNRSGWYISGIAELKKGGIDLSGGPVTRVKAGMFLALRILLSIALAQLTGFFLTACIFAADVNSRALTIYNQANATLITSATATIDQRMAEASKTVTVESAQYAGLSSQLEALRQGAIDPLAGNTVLQQAQQEVAQTLTRKAKADDDLHTAQTFETNEMGGVRGSPGNSGHAGNGPKHKAAMEAVRNARENAEQMAQALAAARLRLDKLRDELARSSDQTKQASTRQAPEYEKALAAEKEKLDAAKAELDQLTHNRGEMIRDLVDNTPGHVGLNRGLLAQIVALEDIAGNDRKVSAMIILIEAATTGFELAAVLVKVTCYVPTTYAALLVRDVYLSNIRVAEELLEELNGTDEFPSEDVREISEGDHDKINPGTGAAARDEQEAFDALAFANIFDLPTPPKRPRGRPKKKTPLN